MVFVVEFRGDIAKLTQGLRLKQKQIENATRRAINKTAEQVKTEASKKIRQERALPVRIINAALKLKRANLKDLTARITATGRPIAIKYYGAAGPRGRPKKVGITRDARGRFTGGTGSPPVTVQVIRGRRKVVRGGFFGPNGHVFKRTGKARTPIKRLSGPSISSAMVKRVVNQAMVQKTREVFPRLFSHELRRVK